MRQLLQTRTKEDDRNNSHKPNRKQFSAFDMPMETIYCNSLVFIINVYIYSFPKGGLCDHRI